MIMTLKEMFTLVSNGLKAHGIVVSDIKMMQNTAEFIQFRTSFSNWVGQINIYSSKKNGFTIDMSRFGDNPESAKIIELIQNIDLSEFKHKITIPAICLQRLSEVVASQASENVISNPTVSEKFPLFCIGADEVGKGGACETLVTAAFCIDNSLSQEAMSILKHMVADSKTLTDGKIRQVAQLIKNYCAGKYVIHTYNPREYNAMYAKYGNLNVLLAQAHARNIAEAVELINIECPTVVVDQFASNNVVSEALSQRNLLNKVNLIETTRAEEKSMAVAAASVLARDAFLSVMDERSKEIGVTVPRGANMVGSFLARVHNKHDIGEVAKLHFTPVKEFMRGKSRLL
ncbi:hypothetical protein EO92_15535 [Methanosarcina sp. 2.H.A.1B.4]|nr:hypothetical protein EO92_15535 [Methanosarcina sp. 2.H.A.1B.4]